jgi:hypothetical protein
VELRQLPGALGDGPVGGVGEFLGDLAAQVAGVGFQGLVCAEWFGFLCGCAHELKDGNLVDDVSLRNAFLGVAGMQKQKNRRRVACGGFLKYQ